MVFPAGAVLALRAAVRVPDTSVPSSLLPPVRRPRLAVQIGDAIYATSSTSVLPVSHCASKLGGQVPIAQRFDKPFFGTTVPSDHDGDRLTGRKNHRIGPDL